MSPVVEEVLSQRPTIAHGTSGTLENIAALCGSAPSPDGKEAAVIESEKLSRLVGKLLETRARDRERIEGLDAQRRDQIVAGALLAHEIFRRLGLKQMTLCGSALREGILVEYIGKHLRDLAVRRQVPDPRRRSVLQLARRCNWEQPHSQHVTALALQLFDQLTHLHGMGQKERELIEYGCLLHDIGWHIAGKKHHRHSMYLILHGDLKGFNEAEASVIANIARYHRKSPPRSTDEPYAALPPRCKKIVRVGSAILRIADGLDRSHNHVVSSLRCRMQNGEVRVRLDTRGDPALEIWGANRKKDFFESVFRRPISFKTAKD